MDEQIKYTPGAIDTNLLSVFDVVDEGKVVTAEKWTTLWSLVFKNINNIDAFCVGVEAFINKWEDAQTALQTVVDAFNVKYTAFSEGFVHYGETEPTNEHIRFWVKPVEAVSKDKLTTYEDVEKYVTERLAQWNVARAASITLPVGGWSNTAPYSQVVNLAGITANSKIDLTPTPQQLNEFYNKGCTFVVENKNKIITVYCIGNVPPSDYTIPITITEVDV